jgi:steroid 5-alpha reductase family enzyme
MTNFFWLIIVGILLTLTSFFLVMAIYNTVTKEEGTRYWWFIFIFLLALVAFSFWPYYNF